MKTVHIIFNAHLDPVWLWSWREGLDEVLNTSYYMCNLLDRNPDIIFTRGEAWVYEQILRIDPALFKRIKGHIAAGRWATVGGWYIQPDCNLPSGFAMERQIALGKEFFTKHFGEFPDVGYNVDSFGHAAALPGLMRSAGQSSYVMMRPQEHEMKLPAHVFRWRGYEDGPEVTTFRITHGYCSAGGLDEQRIHAALSALPDGVTHTMSFIGIGDHGGGPTLEMIDWCRAHRDAFPGARLEFSSPSKFFKAIESEASKLPLVIGELQMHAVGCYTVHRPIKLGVRRAEHRLIQAEIAGKEKGDGALLDEAWKKVCFNHFHDTLGGTCLPSAYQAAESELGFALASADEAATIGLRRRLMTLPDDPSQRIVLFHASDVPFDDYVEVEPWLEWTPWKPTWGLVNERDEPIPFQAISPETAWPTHQVRLLFPVKLAPGDLQIAKIVNFSEPPGGFGIPTSGASVSLGNQPGLHFPGSELPLPILSLFDDLTDTWSHGVDRYVRDNAEAPVWEAPCEVEKGSLMTAMLQKGRIGNSELIAEWRTYSGRPWIELRLRVLWNEKRRMLKLAWAMPAGISEREDGIMGGSLQRPCDGRELPLRDWTLLRSPNGDAMAGVVCPDVFAIDGDEHRIGLSLLRSCAMACHLPNEGKDPRMVFSDQGHHEFRIRFFAGRGLDTAILDATAINFQQPPLTAEFTRGMKNRALNGHFWPAVTVQSKNK